MVNEQTKPAQRRRIGLRFGMRALLLGMAVTCCYFGYLAHKVQSRRAAIERIEELGGRVAFEYHLDASVAVDLERERPRPSSWWQTLLPEELRVEVYYIDLGDTEATDEDVELISSLSEAKHLYLYRTQITNDSARHLTKFAELESLSLSYTEIGDEAMPRIARMRNVSMLALAGTNITDKGLLSFAQSEQFSSISLVKTAVTEDGVRQFSAEGNRFRQLFLSGSPAAVLIDHGGFDNLLLPGE